MGRHSTNETDAPNFNTASIRRSAPLSTIKQLAEKNTSTALEKLIINVQEIPI